MFFLGTIIPLEVFAFCTKKNIYNLLEFFSILEIFSVAFQLQVQYLFLIVKDIGEFYDSPPWLEEAMLFATTLHLYTTKLKSRKSAVLPVKPTLVMDC